MPNPTGSQEKAALAKVSRKSCLLRLEKSRAGRGTGRVRDTASQGPEEGSAQFLQTPVFQAMGVEH